MIYKVYNYIIILIVFGAIEFACNDKSNFKNEKWQINSKITYYNEVLRKTIPKQLGNLKVLGEKDIKYDLYKIYYPGGARELHKNELQMYQSGLFKSFIEGDLNNNGQMDVLLIAIEPSRKFTYAIIVEKQKDRNRYQYLTHFKFNYFIIYIIGAVNTKNNEIRLGYQSGTDWTEHILWDGRRFILKPIDPYGP